MTDAIQARRSERRDFDPTPTTQDVAAAPRGRSDVADAPSMPYSPAIPQGAGRIAGPPPSLEAIAGRIADRRAELANAREPADRARIGREIAQAQGEWSREASLRWKPPSPGFDPNRASDGELVKAYTWLACGGAVPAGELARDGGRSYAQNLEAAIAVRAPWVKGAPKLEAFPPDVQRRAIESALARHGARCEPGDDLPTLRGKLAKAEQAAKTASLEAGVNRTEAEGKRKAIGLDGRQGSSAALGDYEMAEYLKAMNPGTTTGAITAGLLGGGKVEDMRRAGEAGNVVEATAGVTVKDSPKGVEPRFGMEGKFASDLFRPGVAR